MQSVQLVSLLTQRKQGDVQGQQTEPLKYFVLAMQVHVFPLRFILLESIQL